MEPNPKTEGSQSSYANMSNTNEVRDDYIPNFESYDNSDGDDLVIHEDWKVDEGVINGVVQAGVQGRLPTPEHVLPTYGWTNMQMNIINNEIKKLNRLPHALVLYNALNRSKTVEQIENLLEYLEKLNSKERCSSEVESSVASEDEDVSGQPSDTPQIVNLIHWIECMKHIQRIRGVPSDLSAASLGKAVSQFADKHRGKAQIYNNGRLRYYLDYHRIIKHLSTYIIGKAIPSLKNMSCLENALLLEILNELKSEKLDCEVAEKMAGDFASRLVGGEDICIEKYEEGDRMNPKDMLSNANANPFGVCDDNMNIKYSNTSKTPISPRKPVKRKYQKK